MNGNSQGKIVLKFESDWHIGTGTGIPGSTDKLIFRDADGFPAVPAKTLNGIWRDAMETLCDGLGNGWEKWVEFIFGIQPNEIKKDELKQRLSNDEKTYSFSILNLQPARISKNLRDAIGDDERLKQALTFIKAGIAIDNASGTAKENCLRFEEMGRSGTVLEAEFDLQTDDETAKALLVLSGELIERIGGKRRRGAGKCKFEVEGLKSKEDAIKHIEKFQNELKAPIPPPITNDFNDIDLIESDQSTEWQTLEYRLTLQTPVSIVTAVLGNVSESLDFIPGTYLLPHITKNLGGKVRSAVANGDFQVSPATIEIEFPKINEQGEIEKDENDKTIFCTKRGFPIPKVFAQEKMNKEIVYNRLTDKFGEENLQIKPIGEGFVTTKDDGTILHATNPSTLLIHNTVEDKVQRPTSDVGGVYSREAIKAGTVLRGEIRWKKFLNLEDQDFENLKNYVRLGTSKKDDYGLADFEIIGKPKDFAGKSVENAKPQELVAYFASDVLLRNDNLRQTNLVEDLKKELEKTFGVGMLKSYDELLNGAKENPEKNPNDNEANEFIKSRKGLINSIIQVRRIESWQVSWGFPRPTLTAMSAGSVVVFETKDKIDLAKLEEIESNGIGERRGEGYGQIIFNPQILEVSKPDWQKGKLTEAEKPKNDGKLDDDFSRQIELTAWREELKVAVLKIAANEDWREKIFGFEFELKNGEKKSIPPMSQIGGLRSVISRLQNRTNVNLIKSWLEHLEKTSNRLEKWHKDKTKAVGKLQKIERLVSDKSEIWRVLRAVKIDEKPVWKNFKSITEQNLEENENLWAEAVRALFYACQHAHKRDLEKSDRIKEAANG